MVDDMESLTVTKLKDICKEHSIKYKKRLSKDKLIELIKENVNSNVISINSKFFNTV